MNIEDGEADCDDDEEDDETLSDQKVDMQHNFMQLGQQDLSQALLQHHIQQQFRCPTFKGRQVSNQEVLDDGEGEIDEEDSTSVAESEASSVLYKTVKRKPKQQQQQQQK